MTVFKMQRFQILRAYLWSEEQLQTLLSGAGAVLCKLPISTVLFVRPFLPRLTLLCVKGGAVYKVGWMSGRGRCGTACKGTCPWMWGYRCKAGCVGFSGLMN